jgi:hypothetical protein
LVAASSLAQLPPASAQSGNDNGGQQAQSGTQQQNSNVPNAQFLLALVRSVMIAIDNGMTTGNFTVLRDLGTPRFSSLNTPTDLGVAFKGLMDRNVSFKATAVTTPTLTVAPFIDANNALVLEGKFPTRPLEIQFQLSFQVFQRQWRLSTLNVNTAQAPPQAASNGNGQQE